MSLPEAVAIAGQMRSAGQMRRLGYSGSWGPAGTLDNSYFKTLMVGGWGSVEQYDAVVLCERGGGELQ